MPTKQWITLLELETLLFNLLWVTLTHLASRLRLKRNAVEKHQISLELEEDYVDTPLIWRFYLNPISNGVDYSPSISFLGFNGNGNVICIWEYETVVGGPFVTDKPESVEIDEPLLVRKKKVQKKVSDE
ncbi:hypothetical protein [Vibrio anguillarum]|uniref:hypothetical protein n=1 Tax=Vibrio anguillarum TaxID=55601 RepID=UPI001F227993|nr:hypothetical protein [Vibrio anguillarum]